MKNALSILGLYVFLVVVLWSIARITGVNTWDGKMGWGELWSALLSMFVVGLVIGGLYFLIFNTFEPAVGWALVGAGTLAVLIIGLVGFFWLLESMQTVLGSGTFWGLVLMIPVTVLVWVWPRSRKASAPSS